MHRDDLAKMLRRYSTAVIANAEEEGSVRHAWRKHPTGGLGNRLGRGIVVVPDAQGEDA